MSICAKDSRGTAGPAAALLDEAARAQIPADLCPSTSAAGAARAALIAELFDSPAIAEAPARALWNLLAAAAILCKQVDIYAAARLFAAVERLFTQTLGGLVGERGELADAVEMTFDFFFADGEQPLEGVRMEELMAALERILALDNRYCQRAALHGLSHLIERYEGATRARLQAVIDRFLATDTEGGLADYARAARAGELI